MNYESEVVSIDTGKTVETPAPEVEPQPEPVEATPEEEVEGEVVETAKEPEKVEESNLVELPDGRKLPPKEAEKEYRNLYSDYTQKSQRLSKYERGTDSTITNKQPLEKKEWIPETWDEVLERSKQALREDMEREKMQEQEYRQEVEGRVSAELSEIKKENPNLNETQLFNHALKYNFKDLKLAHINMKDMQASIRNATEATAKNLQKRNAEPISGGVQGGAVFDGDAYDPGARSMSMVDYLRSIKQ